MGVMRELNNLRASLVGNLESLILLLSAYTARLALILKSRTVGMKEQFFADIVKPKYLKDLTFSSITFLV